MDSDTLTMNYVYNTGIGELPAVDQVYPPALANTSKSILEVRAEFKVAEALCKNRTSKWWRPLYSFCP